MKATSLGDFEELILMTVLIAGDEAYAVSVKRDLEARLSRKINISAIHTALYRLEEKGMLQSGMSEPVSKRGGKRRRLFRITPLGKKALDDSRELRTSLHDQIPAKAFQWSQ